jgi:hypothetical protein
MAEQGLKPKKAVFIKTEAGVGEEGNTKKAVAKQRAQKEILNSLNLEVAHLGVHKSARPQWDQEYWDTLRCDAQLARAASSPSNS